METMVLKMTFINDLGEKGTVSIKDINEMASEIDIADLMNKIIMAGFLIKNTKATLKHSAQIIKTTIQDMEVLDI